MSEHKELAAKIRGSREDKLLTHAFIDGYLTCCDDLGLKPPPTDEILKAFAEWFTEGYGE